jgi:CheY-like chemotaxis protein
LAKEEVLEVNGIIEELLGFLKLNLKNVTVKKDLSKDRIFLRADRTKISQIIINLIINAKEALERTPSPKINVKSSEVHIKDQENLLDGHYARIEIADNGPGIKKDNLKKIFEPFFSTKSKSKSTGIGLATVREIILDYSGEIEVKSVINKGTSFIFYLPSVQEDVYETVAETKEKLETKIEGSILLVDDEKVVQDIGRDMLNSVGIKCLTAANGEEGLKLFKENKDNISVVILDVEMPGMSGDKVAEKMKKIKPEIKILFASGYAKDYLESKVFKGKIKNFMPKPFFLNQLLFKLNELIKSDSPT